MKQYIEFVVDRLLLEFKCEKVGLYFINDIEIWFFFFFFIVVINEDFKYSGFNFCLYFLGL